MEETVDISAVISLGYYTIRDKQESLNVTALINKNPYILTASDYNLLKTKIDSTFNPDFFFIPESFNASNTKYNESRVHLKITDFYNIILKCKIGKDTSVEFSLSHLLYPESNETKQIVFTPH